MRVLSKINPVVRAIAVIGAAAGLTTAVTFAALTSNTATLTDNTISSATADLQIANVVGGVCDDFGTTATGFAFAGIVPGGAGSQIETFCLKNNGTADLSMKALIPGLPTWTVTPSGTVDNGEVAVNINCGSGAFTLSSNLQDLANATQSFAGGNLAANGEVQCTIQISMSAAAFTGSSASLSNFNLDFSGVGA